jgi:arylsulfatase A-like enzyme
MADTITRKAVQFVESNKAKPFFLYFAAHDIHVPRVPHPRFAGKSGMGPRGDAILEFDWSVGQLLDTLDRLGLADKTLVILTSDNGPVVDDGYKDDAVEKLGDHKPAGPFRGSKYSLFEGGTRVPFLVRWPGRVKPGVSDALVCQIDMLASLAALVGQTLPDDAAPDSMNVLAAFLGDAQTGRERLVHHANGLALREGAWKFIPGRPGVRQLKETKVETGNNSGAQLYDLAADPGETHDVASEHPDLVTKFTKVLENQRSLPKTRP